VGGVWRQFAGGTQGEPMPPCPERRDVTPSQLLAEGTHEIPRVKRGPRQPGYRPAPKASGPNVDMDGTVPSELTWAGK
jgi:hypothetical protein